MPLLAVALAWVASDLMRCVEAYQIEILLSFSLALAGYQLAETLRLSAPLEAVATGLALQGPHHQILSCPIESRIYG